MYRTSGEGGQLNAVSPRASMLRVGLGALICVAALAACATVPEVSPPRPEDHLLPNHAAYFGLNVSENLHLVSYLARTMGLDADVVLNRVNIVAGSLALDESAEPAFFGVALGRFPAGATRFALWKDRGFRRAVTHIPSADDQDGDETRLIFFRQADGPIEIAVPESGVILVSNRSVADLVTATGPPHPARDDGAAANLSDPGRIDPAIVERIGLVSTIGPGAGLREADTGTDLVIVLADPVAILSNSLGLELPRFPILQIALMATASDQDSPARSSDEDEAVSSETPAAASPDPAPGPAPPPVMLELAGEFEFVNESQALLFGRLGRGFVLAFVRALGLEGADLRETVSIETDGTRLLFGGIMATPDEVAGLVTRISGRM